MCCVHSKGSTGIQGKNYTFQLQEKQQRERNKKKRDFNAHNLLWGSEKMSTRGRLLEKILNRYNLLCLNEKEETYNRAYDGCKSLIDLTLANLTIVPEYKWSKEHKFRGIDHFPIIIEDKREVPTKQQQRWSTGNAN